MMTTLMIYDDDDHDVNDDNADDSNDIDDIDDYVWTCGSTSLFSASVDAFSTSTNHASCCGSLLCQRWWL